MAGYTGIDASGAVITFNKKGDLADISPALVDAGAAWTTVRGVSGAAVVSADATSATAVTDAPTSGQVMSVGNGTAMVILDGGTNTIQCVSSIALRRLQYVMVERSGSEYKVLALAQENDT